MSNKEDSNFVVFLGGLMLGGIVGAAIAAVSTPYTGDEAKNELSNLYKNGLDKASDLKDKSNASLNQFKGVTQEKFKILVQNLKEKANNIAHRFEDITSKGAGVLIEDEIV